MRITLLWFFCIAVLVCFLLPASSLASGSKYHGTVLERKATCEVILMSKDLLGNWLSWQTSVEFWNNDSGKEEMIGLFNCTMSHNDKYECSIRYINTRYFILAIGPDGDLAPGTSNAHKKLCNEAFSFLNDRLEFRNPNS